MDGRFEKKVLRNVKTEFNSNTNLEIYWSITIPSQQMGVRKSKHLLHDVHLLLHIFLEAF